MIVVVRFMIRMKWTRPTGMSPTRTTPPTVVMIDVGINDISYHHCQAMVVSEKLHSVVRHVILGRDSARRRLTCTLQERKIGIEQWTGTPGCHEVDLLFFGALSNQVLLAFLCSIRRPEAHVCAVLVFQSTTLRKRIRVSWYLSEIGSFWDLNICIVRSVL